MRRSGRVQPVDMDRSDPSVQSLTSRKPGAQSTTPRRPAGTSAARPTTTSGEWLLYAYDPSGRPVVGLKQRECRPSLLTRRHRM